MTSPASIFCLKPSYTVRISMCSVIAVSWSSYSISDARLFIVPANSAGMGTYAAYANSTTLLSNVLNKSFCCLNRSSFQLNTFSCRLAVSLTRKISCKSKQCTLSTRTFAFNVELCISYVSGIFWSSRSIVLNRFSPYVVLELPKYVRRKWMEFKTASICCPSFLLI